ncbi:proteoglycan 4-like [Spodoptera litura]|uniref:Proteoglycan 4-like n=1 Tax=Spodoptera litura TaxID=69820 RepID=A0A9J7EVV8_SPOLT|nr:proteoglycan 4-like [Spodoptera litura]
MHLENLGYEKCDVSSLFKAIDKETQTKKPNAVKNTNCSEKSFKLPLPRELEKKDNEEGTLKVFSFSQIIQDPDCPTSVTIVKESLTEEAHPHNDDACSNKYKYCKEVIKPFLQPYPPGCPNSGQLLINDAVKAASEEFPENPPCYEVPAPDKNKKQNCGTDCQQPPVSKCPSKSCSDTDTDSDESDCCSQKPKKNKFCESPKKEAKCCTCTKKEKKKDPCDSGPKPNFRLCPGQTEPKICIEITDPSLCPGCPKPRCGKKPADKCCCACLIGKQDLDNPPISPQKSNNSSWPSGIESDCCDKSSESKSCIGKLLTSLKTLSDSCLKKGKSTKDKPLCSCGKPPCPPPPCPPPPCPPPPCPPPPSCSCDSPKPKKCPPKPCPPKPCPPKPCPPKPCPTKQCPPKPCPAEQCPPKPCPAEPKPCPPKPCPAKQCPPPPCPPKPKPCSPKPCPAKAKPCPPPPCPPKPKPCSPKPCPAKQCPPQPCPRPCPPKPCPPKPCPAKQCPSKECPAKPSSPKTCPPPNSCPANQCPPKPCPAKQCPSKECPAKPSSPKPCPPNPCPAKQCPSKDFPARPSPPNPCPARPCPPMPCSTSRNTMVDSPRENPSNKNKPCPHETPNESSAKERSPNKNKPCPHETHDESCDKECPSNKNKSCPHETHDECSAKERSPNKNKPCPHETHDESCDKECPSNKNKSCPHETHDECSAKERSPNKNKPCPHETHDESCDKDCPSNKNKPCPHETHDESCDKECPYSAKKKTPNRYKPCPYEIPVKSSDKEHPPSRYKPCPTEIPDENSVKKSTSHKNLCPKNSKADFQSKTSSKDIHGKNNGTSSGLVYSSPKGPCKVNDITSQLVQVENTNEKPHVTNTGGLCCSCGEKERPTPKHACKNPARTPPVCNPNSSSMLGKSTMDAHNETIATLKCAMKDFMCKVFRTTQDAVSVISCEGNKQYEKLKKSVSDLTSDCPPPKKVSNESGNTPSNNNLRRFSIINMNNLPEKINLPPCKPPEPYPSTASGYFEAALDKVSSAASMISRSLVFELPAQIKRSYNDDSSEYDIPNYTKPKDVDNLMNPFEVNVFTTIKDKIWSIFVDDDKQEREIRSTMSSSESLTSESDEDLINKIID